MALTLSRKPRFSFADSLGGFEELREQAQSAPVTRSFSFGLLPTPEGGAVVGVRYICDFAAEEEWGAGDLIQAFCGRNGRMRSGAEQHAAWFSDVNGLVLSGKPLEAREFAWGERFSRHGYDADYARFWREQLPWSQCHRRRAHTGMTLPMLHQVAADAGLARPWPRTKSALVDAIVAAGVAPLEATAPEAWPGWFADGVSLILRADGDGITARALGHVREAAQAGALRIGLSDGLARGLFMWDARDETRGLRAARAAHVRFCEQAGREAERIGAQLREQGFAFLFLGTPKQRDGETIFWLNGLTLRDPARARQVLPAAALDRLSDYRVSANGWFTADELLSHRFVDALRSS